MTEDATKPGRASWVLWLPLALVLGLGVLFWRGLSSGGESRLIQSQWIDKPVPEFDLPPAMPGQPGVSSRQFSDGKPRLINVFASWCIPCRVEAPQLEALRERGVQPGDTVRIGEKELEWSD